MRFPLINVISFVASCALAACTPASRSDDAVAPQEQQALAAQQARSAVLEEFADTHNGVAYMEWPWNGRIMNPVLTIEVEDTLIRADGRPIVFMASVTDLKRSGSGYELSLSPSLYAWGLADVYFLLECDDDVAAVIRTKPPSRYDLFKVAARIDKVTRPSFTVEAEGSDDQARTMVVPSTIFIASGQCLALARESSDG